MNFKTPSGYIVELKDKLTFGEMRLLQKGLFEGMTAEIGKTPQLSMTKLLEFGEKAFPLLVTKITIDGKEVEGDLLKVVNSWDNEDGEALFNQINVISQPQVDNKKK